ncbi:ATP-binding protein [Streptomyces sp. TRM49041]|uniref:ATP-binding protein n=1 Tax=Streptomyces sp. TRM49041 TaxID=2603216 RepID=UPI0011EFF9EF|nr:ATP-binding protein [Streptomyces sp. TRM49041]
MDGGGVVVLRWICGPRSVGLARRELRAALAGWKLAAVEDAALLVLSELLTNAVRHAGVAGRPVETRFARMPCGLRIEVHDASERRPRPTAREEGGWGLPLVAALATRWGVTGRAEGGKSVWAELEEAGPDAH